METSSSSQSRYLGAFITALLAVFAFWVTAPPAIPLSRSIAPTYGVAAPGWR